MTVFADETSVSSLVHAMNKAIKLIINNDVDTSKFHDAVAKMYDWEDVAERTVQVYNSIDKRNTSINKNWTRMLIKYYQKSGTWARMIYMLCSLVEYILFYILEILYPTEHIDRAVKWSTQ